MSDHSLKGYSEFVAIRDLQVKPRHLGLHGRTGDVNRLNARVRMAKAFKSMTLESYKEGTVDAYTSMFRVFLCFTAFEVFGYLHDRKPYKFMERCPDHPWDEVSATISNCDPGWIFTDALIEMIGPSGNQRSLEDFKNDHSRNPMSYAQAIRNAFAHGHLTPHTGGADPGKVKVLCDALSELMLTVMDEEFSKVVMPRYEEYIRQDLL